MHFKTASILSVKKQKELKFGAWMRKGGCGERSGWSGSNYKTILLAMKLTSLFLFFAFMTASATGKSQTVTLSMEHVAIQKVFKEISRQTGISIVYSEKSLKVISPVTIHVKGATVEAVMETCLKGKPFTYSIEGNLIIVRPKLNATADFPGFDNRNFPIDVKGRVVNEAGEPVAGASVMIKGTNTGTVSNNDGYFELRDVDENAILIISAINIESYEVKVNAGGEMILARVKVKITEQEEVTVNAGYYKVKQREVTGNISRVDAKEIEKQPVGNILGALQGRVPGLDIVQQTGVPGGNYRVRIRGQNSIVNGNEPLYIIDGVPYSSGSLTFPLLSGQILSAGSSPLSIIDPLQIENVEILKDADATAIYGSRGANGVILITTKKGSQGKTKVDFNFSRGGGKVGRKMDLMDRREYLDMRYEAFRNDNTDWTSPLVSVPDLKLWDTTRYTDWQKELLGKTAHYTDAQIVFSGGEKNTQFSLAGGFHKETTVFPGDHSDQRISTRFNIHNKSLNDKLEVTASVNYNVNTTALPVVDLTFTALMLAPVAPPLYTADGNLNWGPDSWNGFDLTANPISYVKQYYESKTNVIIGNAGVEFKALPNLIFKANMGFNHAQMKAIHATPLSTIDPVVAAYADNSSYFGNNSTRSWIMEPQANWNMKIGEGMLGLIAGGSFLEQINEGDVLVATGYSSEELMRNMNAANRIDKSSSTYAQYRYSGVFGRLNYNFKRRYIVNLTGRRDGSSRFGPNKQFATFGAAGAAWIFSEERFSKGLPFLSFGKLRASYGTAGNDQIGDYQYLDTYSPRGSGPYMGITGLSPQRLFNPDFGWEEVKKFEAGIEIGLFKQRIITKASYYQNRSSNQLVGMSLPPTTGFISIQSNLPAKVENRGLEIELDAIAAERKNFSWGVGFNITIPRNELIEYPGLESSQYSNYYAVGEPLDIRKRYHYTGVNTQTGMHEVEDVNGDNLFNQFDRTNIVFVGQEFYGGMVNNIGYKNFELGFLFQFVKQTGTNYLSYSSIAPGRMAFNVPVYFLDRWQRPGDATDIQRFSTSGVYQTAYDRFTVSDRSVSDASFIRLKNVEVSWRLPVSMIRKIGADQARLFIQGQNLLTLTGYKGLDPETQYSYLPPLRMITAGAHLTF